MFNQKEYNKCAEFEIILGVISMIIMVMIVLMQKLMEVCVEELL